MIHHTPYGQKLEGFYYGKVVKHMSHGIIKVHIPSVYPAEYETKPDLLPNCMQVVPQFVGNNNGNGIFSYPNIGSIVVCSFLNGDLNYPITIGSLLGGNDAIHQYNIINQIDDYDIISANLSSDKYIHNNTYQNIYDISATSKLHRINSGKTSLTFFEHNDENQGGVISSIITRPIQTHVHEQKLSIFNPEILDTKQDLVIYGTDTKTEGLISALTIDNVNRTKSEVLMTEAGDLLMRTSDWKNSVNTDYVQNTNGKTLIETFDSKALITSFLQLDTHGTVRTQTHDVPNTITCYLHLDTEGIIRTLVENDKLSVKCFTHMDTLGVVRTELLDLDKNVISYKHLDTAGVIRDETRDIPNLISTFEHLDTDGYIDLYTQCDETKITSYSHYDIKGVIHSLTHDSPKQITSYLHLDTKGYIHSLTHNTPNTITCFNRMDVAGHIETNIVKTTTSLVVLTSDLRTGVIPWKPSLPEIGPITVENISTYTVMTDCSYLKTTPTSDELNTKKEPTAISAFVEDGILYEASVPLTPTYCKIYMKNDGTLLIDTTTNVEIKSPVIKLTGSTSITLDAPDITIKGGSSVKMTAPDITIEGSSSVNITGGSGDCLIQNISHVGHMHTGNVGAPTSPPF